MHIFNFIREHIDATILHEDVPFKTQIIHTEAQHIFCEFGQVEDKVAFLVEGFVQANLSSEGNAPKIIDFFLPGRFMASYVSFLTDSPSNVQIIGLTPCTVEVINKQDLQTAYETSLIANKLGRFATERLYIQKVKREKAFLTKTAKERYMDLIAEQPQILDHLSVEMIAKYLGIHPESLSRIRSSKVDN